MNRGEKQSLLHRISQEHYVLGIRRDLSRMPEIFHRYSRVHGLYIADRALHKESRLLSQLEWEAIFYNETDKDNIKLPDSSYVLFRIRDQQEFHYYVALRAPIR